MRIPETCQQGAVAPKEMLETLHPSQGGTGRHKCAICAYSIGFEEGMRYARGLVAAASSSATSSPP